MIVSLVGGGALALLLALLLAWKWELGVRRVAVAVTILALLSSSIVGFSRAGSVLPAGLLAACECVLTLALSFGILAYRFYRDPERRPPDRNDILVSPADGEVIYVRRVREGVLPVSTKHGRHYSLQELTRTPLETDEAIVVGIAMNFLDVHVNRAPIAGRITLQRHFPGRFGSLKHAEMVFENERATTVIERDGLQVAIVQIASRLVRQIVSYVTEGEAVSLGQRFGVIRLGSQVDLVLPDRRDLEVLARVGQHLTAGVTAVARFEPVPHRHTIPLEGQAPASDHAVSVR